MRTLESEYTVERAFSIPFTRAAYYADSDKDDYQNIDVYY